MSNCDHKCTDCGYRVNISLTITDPDGNPLSAGVTYESPDLTYAGAQAAVAADVAILGAAWAKAQVASCEESIDPAVVSAARSQ